MCTVSFIPLPNKGFIFTSNRDENPNRKTSLAKEIIYNNKTLIAPIDQEKGGTWIATNGANKAVCLLNGAFEKHKRILPYRKSRGCITLEAFDAPNLKEYALHVNLNRIEPFTLILIEDDILTELIWDGTKKHVKNLEFNKMHLWSSATLYSREIHKNKLDYFVKKIDSIEITPNNILEAHGKETKTPFILDLENVKTVSITQLIYKNKNILLNYHPLKTILNKTTKAISESF